MLLKPLQSAKACILVIEDDLTLRTSLQRLLAAEGYRPVLMDEAQDEAEGRIDLVIVGAAPDRPVGRFPSLRSVPVLALVDRKAWVGLDFFDLVNELGAAAVLPRPFPRSALLRLVTAVLAPETDAVEHGHSWEGAFHDTAPTPHLPCFEDPRGV